MYLNHAVCVSYDVFFVCYIVSYVSMFSEQLFTLVYLIYASADKPTSGADLGFIKVFGGRVGGGFGVILLL